MYMLCNLHGRYIREASPEEVAEAKAYAKTHGGVGYVRQVYCVKDDGWTISRRHADSIYAAANRGEQWAHEVLLRG